MRPLQALWTATTLALCAATVDALGNPDARSVDPREIRQALELFQDPKAALAAGKVSASFGALGSDLTVSCELVPPAGRAARKLITLPETDAGLLKHASRGDRLRRIAECASQLPGMPLLRWAEKRPGMVTRLYVDAATEEIAKRWLIFHQRLRVGTDEQYRETFRCLLTEVTERMHGLTGDTLIVRTDVIDLKRRAEAISNGRERELARIARTSKTAPRDEQWVTRWAIADGSAADALAKRSLKDTRALRGIWHGGEFTSGHRPRPMLEDTIRLQDKSTFDQREGEPTVNIPTTLLKPLGDDLPLLVGACALQHGLWVPDPNPRQTLPIEVCP